MAMGKPRWIDPARLLETGLRIGTAAPARWPAIAVLRVALRRRGSPLGSPQEGRLPPQGQLGGGPLGSDREGGAGRDLHYLQICAARRARRGKLAVVTLSTNCQQQQKQLRRRGVKRAPKVCRHDPSGHYHPPPPTTLRCSSVGVLAVCSAACWRLAGGVIYHGRAREVVSRSFTALVVLCFSIFDKY